MKNAIAILAVLSLVVFAGQVAVDLDPIQRTDADWLVYDDGSPAFYTWGGMYRGVWFNVEDFVPGMAAADVQESKFWFYHDEVDHVWDTSDVYVEIWNGDVLGPMTQLDQTMITALDYAPVGVVYSPAIEAEGNFWVLCNVEMSGGGWPSILGDDMISATTHSYYSDDFIVWSPWGDPGAFGDYFISCLADLIPSALDNTTWGSLKATF